MVHLTPKNKMKPGLFRKSIIWKDGKDIYLPVETIPVSFIKDLQAVFSNVKMDIFLSHAGSLRIKKHQG